MEYDHMCLNTECNNEWSSEYSIKADPPKICPKCNQETAKRLISGTGHGRMELSDDEFKAGLKDEVKKMKKEMHSSSNVYANYLGEDKYHKLQTEMDRNKRNK